MLRATGQKASGGKRDRHQRVPLAAGESARDLEQVVAALTQAGVDFQVEERLADPERPGEWAWRILVLADQLPAAGRIVESLQRGGQVTVPDSTRAGASRPDVVSHRPHLPAPGRAQLARR